MEEKQEKRTYKKGDRLVRVKGSAVTRIGDVIVCTGKRRNNGKVEFCFEKTGDTFTIDDEYYELEAVVNSPLYKALL